MRDAYAENATEVANRERYFEEFKPKNKEAQERILRDIEIQKNASEAKIIRQFLNNFPGCFPGGFRRKQSQMLRALGGAGGEKQTRYEALYRDIDAFLEATDFKVQNLEQEIGDQQSEEVIRKLIAVYIAMRNKGYTHPELTS
jgi:hypothetical protein